MMKYCLFDGGDVLGPFSAEELQQREGFGPESLVCPQEHSEEETFWKAAREYDELIHPVPKKPAPPKQPKEEPVIVTQQAPSDQEAAQPAIVIPVPPAPMAEQVKETPSQPQADDRAEQLAAQVSQTVGALSALENLEPEALTASVEQVSETAPSQPAASENSSTQNQASEPAFSAQTVGQSSPIEEYFNTMRTGDLGNILGMPDPKANSDMNLSRVLEKQFEKTDPVTGERPMQAGEDPFDEFTKPTPAEPIPQQGTITPQEADRVTQAQLKPVADDTTKTAENSQPEKTSEVQNTPSAQEQAVAALNAAKTDTLPGIHPLDPQAASAAMPHRHRKKRTSKWGAILWSLALVVGLAVFALLMRNDFPFHFVKKAEAPAAAKASQTPAPAPEAPAPTAKKEPQVPALHAAKQPVIAPAPQPVITQTPEELAKEIVQNYVLDKSRGTIEQWLAKHYATQLSSGYAASWSAERLHKQVYVVKFRLAKTRQEPIVYIFQVDTSKKKLTGALNNITLDLVGKLTK